MRMIKEIINNLRNNFGHFIIVIIAFIISFTLFILSDIVLPEIQYESCIDYYGFPENYAFIRSYSGKLDQQHINYFIENDYECVGINQLNNEEIKLKNSKKINISFIGTSGKINNYYLPSYHPTDSLDKIEILYGRDFNEVDVLLDNNAVIICDYLAKLLFETPEQALNQELVLNDKSYLIIGITNTPISFNYIINEYDQLSFNCYVLDVNDDYYTLIIKSKNAFTEIDCLNINSINSYYNNINCKETLINHQIQFCDDSLIEISNVFYIIAYVLIIFIITILINTRKSEIAIKKNLGAPFISILFEYSIEYIINCIFAFILIYLPLHLLIWSIMENIYDFHYIIYSYIHYFEIFFGYFLIEIILVFFTCLVNILIIYLKNIVNVLKE